MPEFSRNMAFVIGINNYGNDIPTLHTAVNDAKKLVEILREKHGYQVWVCLDEVATLKNLNDLFEKTLNQQVKSDDRLLFYFAGHGIALNSEDGPQGYLIPQDAKLGDTKTYLAMTQVYEFLSNLPCRHFLGILDCCFAGAFRWSSTRDILAAPQVIHQERYDRFIADPAWQVITSAASDQKALDALNLNIDRGEIGNHSPFAAALFEALTGGADAYPPATNGKPCGDGVITATELYLYLRDRVELATQAHRQRQTPGIWALNNHDKGEYIFLAPGHELNLPPAPPLDESKNPYRGLQSFEEKDSDLFFGRTALVEKLHKFVTTNPLTVVLGASGSGKSSLVKAGLIPYLKQLEGKDGQPPWRVLAPMRPGESPFRALNNTLTQENIPVVSISNQTYRQTLESLSEHMAAWCQLNPTSKLLLVVDQMEEVITSCRDDQERENFLNFLAVAIVKYPQQLRLVLTLRSDFEPRFQDAVLKKDWQKARFIVPVMTRSQLREAIEEPASARVMYFQSDDSNNPLVDQLIDEVAEMPGALPLLSFTLSELYLKYLKRQKVAQQQGKTIDRAITEADYKELGGVARSLTQRADCEYEELVKQDQAYEQTIRHVMLRMVVVGSGELARRQVPLSELEYPPTENERVKEVIRRFSGARLLVEGRDTDGKPYVEPAHDALVRGWQKLLTWRRKEIESLILQRRLTPAAEEWKNVESKEQPAVLNALAEPLFDLLDKSLYSAENLFSKINTQLVRLWQRAPDEQEGALKKPVQFLWNSNPYLNVLNETLKSNNNWFNHLEAEFVQRSLQRRRYNYLRLMSSVTGVILALSGFAIFAGYQWRQAGIQQIETLSNSSTALLLGHQELEAVQASLRAGEQIKHSFWQTVWRDSELDNRVGKTLQKVLYGVREHNRLQVNSPIAAVTFSADDQMIATTSLDNGTVQLWKPDGTLIPWSHNGRQVQITSSTNAHRYVPVVASSANDQIFALDIEGELVLFFKTEHGAKQIGISSVAFNPTKKIVALAAGGRVVLLSLKGNQLLSSSQGQRGSIAALAFSADGKMLATANTEVNEKQEKIGIIQLWNLENGTVVNTLEGDMGLQGSVAISPDGQMVAASGWYGATLWKSDGTWHKKLDGYYPGQVNALTFSPDGKMIATGGVDKKVRLWQTTDGKMLSEPLVGHSDAVWGVSFRPDGQIIASASNDNTVKLWTSDGTLLKTLEGHGDVVRAVAFSHDGKTIASASDDGTVKLWKAGGTSLKALPHNDPVYAVAFSFDGKTIATTNGHGWITLWNPDGSWQKTGRWQFGAITAVAFSPNGKMIVTAAGDRSVQLRNSDGTSEKFLEGHNGETNQPEVLGVSFSPDSQTIATASVDGTVQLFNSGNGKLQKTLDRQKSPVRDVTFSPNGQMIASANNNGTVKLWKSDGTLKILSGHKSAVTAVAFSPNSQILASASADTTVKLWTNDGTLLKTLSDHKGVVRAVAFSRDGTIATASYDGTVKLWTSDGTLLKTLSGHEKAVVGVAFSPDGKTIASASSDRTVILWNREENLDLKRLLGYGCDWVRDYLKNNPKVSESDRHLCDN